MALITRAQRDQDFCVFIGRFQPLHTSHMRVMIRALEAAEYLIIVIGSAKAARRPDINPFTDGERETIIRDALRETLGNDEGLERVRFLRAEDSDFNTPDWAERIYSGVKEIANDVVEDRRRDNNVRNERDPKLFETGEDARISLIGHAKDKSSYYLRLFRQWNSIETGNFRNISATDIRRDYFSADSEVVDRMFERAITDDLLHVSTINWMRSFQKTEHYAYLINEQKFADKARAVWTKESWPDCRNTVCGDAMIHQGGYVLLIKRAQAPFKDLWALPGGHKEITETVLECALREGYEETAIKVPRTVFERSLVAQDYFDAPHRDPRGCYISHVFLFNLVPPVPVYDTTKSDAENRRRVKDALALPKVKGMDDAAQAKWWHVSEITRPMMAFDHYSVIRKMITRLPAGN